MDATLQTVTRPDSSTWQLGGLKSLLRNVHYLVNGSCDDTGQLATIQATGSLSHPSGAIGEFTLTPTKHGRAAVENVCNSYSGMDVATFPRTFDTFALTNKRISGPGLQAIEWATRYPTPAPSWGPRYTFGTLFQETEGQLQKTEVFDADGTLLRSTHIHYAEPVQPFGYSDQRLGDGVMAARVMETDRRQISQQGVDFVWQAFLFDTFGFPTSVARQLPMLVSSDRNKNFTRYYASPPRRR